MGKFRVLTPRRWLTVTAIALPLALALSACTDAQEQLPTMTPATTTISLSPEASNACAQLAREASVNVPGSVLTAYESTAGLVSQWDETPHTPDGGHASTSRMRVFAPDARVFVCFLGGEFNAPMGPPPATGVQQL